MFSLNFILGLLLVGVLAFVARTSAASSSKALRYASATTSVLAVVCLGLGLYHMNPLVIGFTIPWILGYAIGTAQRYMEKHLDDKR